MISSLARGGKLFSEQQTRMVVLIVEDGLRCRAYLRMYSVCLLDVFRGVIVHFLFAGQTINAHCSALDLLFGEEK